MEVSPITRKHLIDDLVASGIWYSGALTEIEFLERLYPLDDFPSTDRRCANMREDVDQHVVRWKGDWPDHWVWSDGRLRLRTGPSEDFLRFLCEMVHPMVRPKPEEVAGLLAIFNQHLAVDGIEISQGGLKHNRPLYEARRIGSGGGVVRRQDAVIGLGAYVSRQIERMKAHDRDPELAIGTAKELTETVCRTVLSARGESYSKDEDLPKIAKRAMKLVQPAPSTHPDAERVNQLVQRILSNLGNIPHCLAELRNLGGTGHGRESSFEALGPIYARLAVDAAATFAAFVVDAAGLGATPAASEESAADAES